MRVGRYACACSSGRPNTCRGVQCRRIMTDHDHRITKSYLTDGACTAKDEPADRSRIRRINSIILSSTCTEHTCMHLSVYSVLCSSIPPITFAGWCSCVGEDSRMGRNRSSSAPGEGSRPYSAAARPGLHGRRSGGARVRASARELLAASASETEYDGRVW